MTQLEACYRYTNHMRSSHYTVTHVRNENSNIQRRSPNVIKVIYHTIRNSLLKKRNRSLWEQILFFKRSSPFWKGTQLKRTIAWSSSLLLMCVTLLTFWLRHCKFKRFWTKQEVLPSDIEHQCQCSDRCGWSVSYISKVICKKHKPYFSWQGQFNPITRLVLKCIMRLWKVIWQEAFSFKVAYRICYFLQYGVLV